MDSGPFSASRSTERRPVSRATPSPRPAEEPHPTREQPQQHRPVTPRHSDRSGKPKKLILIVIIVAIVVLAVGGWFAWSKLQTAGSAIDTSKYQAVFFTNGQVYFGKLQQLGGDYLKLTDIYYLQSQASDTESSNPQKASSDQQSNNVQLIKLGNEIHGPEDEMIISKDQVLFYENLKSDGKVAQTIAQSKDQ